MTEDNKEIVLLSHGDGGLLTHRLLRDYFLQYFHNDLLDSLSDAAVFPVEPGRMALSTDSFVVDPIFFPGGDIGKIAVCGTVNDLAVSGALPLYLTASFIIEEGLPLEDLKKIIVSMSVTCREAGTKIIAGDTKVVGRGQADKIFITTAGVGYLLPQADLGYQRLNPGDKVLVNGSLGNHGLAIMLQRTALSIDNQIISDCAPLNLLTTEMVKNFPGIKLMRDLTRGGMATNAKEVAMSAQVDFWLDEVMIPIDDQVRGITELLGLDPLYLANEGKFLTIVAEPEAKELLDYMQKELGATNARVIGEIRQGGGNVYVKTAMGGTRPLKMLAGAPLPRIC
ncbi:MAG: hydrogenase expression/formation protein HypE [Peptococcaceae bacterium]|nr:hydrogenase expression/formation protein HypE [Peptococcaceae bacterium]